jgi:small subunit ribosomal protein S8
MPVTDPIADMLTRIRNAIHRRKDEVRVRSSKLVLSVAETLKAEGFIESFEIVKNEQCPVQNDVVVRIKYGPRGESIITRMVRISKPGCRVYAKVDELKPVLRGLGIQILSTPKGVMSDRAARASKVGGEVLCRVE